MLVIFISLKYEYMQNLGAHTKYIHKTYSDETHENNMYQIKNTKAEYVKVQNISKYKTSWYVLSFDMFCDSMVCRRYVFLYGSLGILSWDMFSDFWSFALQNLHKTMNPGLN